jgi:hypothetical protein
MSVQQGIRRMGVFISILYWIVVAKAAVLRASYGIWDGGNPMGFFGVAAFCYLIIFGFFWTLDGFFCGPPRRW